MASNRFSIQKIGVLVRLPNMKCERRIKIKVDDEKHHTVINTHAKHARTHTNKQQGSFSFRNND